MSGAQDFVIENGVLKKYAGPGGDVVIPEEVKEIGSWYEYTNRGLDVRQYGAFQYCETVRRVVIPASVKKIASYAFHNCTQLEEVEFQGEVSALGQNAFQGTPWLERQCFGNVYYVNGCAAGIREGAREAAVRPGTRCIVPEAFQGCGSLERISLPEGLTEIGDRAFSQCAHLSELALPESLKKLGREALRDCTGLRELKIPPNVSSIGAGAFAGCAGLERLDLSGAARQKKLSACLCEGCASLREVLLPPALNYIGKQAFAGCRAWQSLALSGAVSVVSPKAFADCGLTRLTLGEGVERIEREAFAGCSLEEVDFPASVSLVEADAFRGCPLKRVSLGGRDVKLYARSLGESLEELRVEHMPVSAVPAEYRPAALQTFARRYLAGEALPAAHREDCLKYIKSQRRRLWQDPWVLRVILREKYITAGEIAGYTGKIAQLNNPELTAALLEYRNQNFTQEQIDRAEKKKIEKTLRDMG